jgi:hypothetical protein
MLWRNWIKTKMEGRACLEYTKNGYFIITNCIQLIIEYLEAKKIWFTRRNRHVYVKDDISKELAEYEENVINDFKKCLVQHMFVNNNHQYLYFFIYGNRGQLIYNSIVDSLRIGIRLMYGDKRKFLWFLNRKLYLSIILSLRFVKRLPKDIERMIIERLFNFSRKHALIYAKNIFLVSMYLQRSWMLANHDKILLNQKREPLWNEELVEKLLQDERSDAI